MKHVKGNRILKKKLLICVYWLSEGHLLLFFSVIWLFVQVNIFVCTQTISKGIQESDRELYMDTGNIRHCH